MVEYKDRLAEAMQDANVSAKWLAGKLGLSYQAVKKVLDGKSASFTAQNHDIVATLLKVSSSWLANGIGQKTLAGGPASMARQAATSPSAPTESASAPNATPSEDRQRMTAGETLSLAAEVTAGLSLSRRKAIAALAAEMIENGPSPDEIASIDALAPGLFLDSVTSETTLKSTLLRLAHEHPDKAKREIITEFLNQAMLFITEQKRINVTPAATNVRAAV